MIYIDANILTLFSFSFQVSSNENKSKSKSKLRDAGQLFEQSGSLFIIKELSSLKLYTHKLFFILLLFPSLFLDWY